MPISIVRFDKLISTFARSTRVALIALALVCLLWKLAFSDVAIAVAVEAAAVAAVSISHFLATCA